MTLSVVMCTYNGAPYIRQQIDSILGQTLQPDEIFIQDDGSTDETMDILKEYAATDKRIHVFQNSINLGLNANFYSAIGQVQTDYIALSDQDDIWLPDKLSKQIKALQSDKWMCFHLSHSFYGEIPEEINNFDSRIPNFGTERILFKAACLGHTMLFKRKLWEKFVQMVGDKERDLFMYDTMLSIVAAAYGKTVYIPEPLVLHRRLNTSLTFVSQETERFHKRSVLNAAKLFLDNLSPTVYKQTEPRIRKRFSNMNRVLDCLENSDSASTQKIISAFFSPSRFIRFPIQLVKNRQSIFYSSEQNDVIAIFRAVTYNIIMRDYFRT